MNNVSYNVNTDVVTANNYYITLQNSRQQQFPHSSVVFCSTFFPTYSIEWHAVSVSGKMRSVAKYIDHVKTLKIPRILYTCKNLTTAFYTACFMEISHAEPLMVRNRLSIVNKFNVKWIKEPHWNCFCYTVKCNKS